MGRSVLLASLAGYVSLRSCMMACAQGAPVPGLRESYRCFYLDFDTMTYVPLKAEQVTGPIHLNHSELGEIFRIVRSGQPMKASAQRAQLPQNCRFRILQGRTMVLLMGTGGWYRYNHQNYDLSAEEFARLKHLLNSHATSRNH